METKEHEVPAFREEQYFRQGWVILIILGIALWFWYIFFVQIAKGMPFGQHPMPTPVLIVFWLVMGWGLPILFFFTKLVTEVRSNGIHIRFIPFFRKFKKFEWVEIQQYYIRKYRPIREYGGWGIRRGLGGKAFSIRGNIGLQLELEFPQKLLIGTQKPEEFIRVLQQYIPEKHKQRDSHQ